ncbi:abasic site processing protein HMCES isoform X2 [Leptidea sinapis]|uniref:abasic site processing protein HMCES isoform X2 n=1 Tax=Leptidea sinapis TaxID=189913 RepID=UPI0021C3A239|nr:abasic site processing protein HMCES isoform X2 [Leptidea sinapis]
MCGRTGLSLDKEQLRCACRYRDKSLNDYVKPSYLTEYNDGKEYSPSFNIAPTDITPVLVSARNFLKDSDAGQRILKPMMWGIIPPWHKGDYKSHKLTTNNCRIENIRYSKLYSPILNNGGRCVIVAEGFYEWQTTIKTKIKQPYYIYMKQDFTQPVDDNCQPTSCHTTENVWENKRLLYMAGLYNVWQDSENKNIYSYSVITLESNDVMSWLHDRMPAILECEQQIESWLDVDNVPAEKALSHLLPAKNLEWHPVSTIVNNSKYKSSDCNKKIDLESKVKSSQKPLTEWFKKANKRKSEHDIDHDSVKRKL